MKHYWTSLGTRRLRRKAVEFRQTSGMYTNLLGMRMRVKRANDAHVKVRRVTRLFNELYRTHLRSLCTLVCETYILQFLLQIHHFMGREAQESSLPHRLIISPASPHV